MACDGPSTLEVSRAVIVRAVAARLVAHSASWLNLEASYSET